MNKKLIALAVAGIAAAGTASAAEIYKSDDASVTMGGRAEARLSVKDGEADDLSRVRLNFLGKTMISDNLYGVGFYEGEFASNDRGEATDDNSDSLANRYIYAGIGGNFGEITYGKNDGALGVLTDFTDIMAYHGNSAAYKLNVADRADNMISYKGSFADFDLKASYRFSDRVEVTNDNGDTEYTNNNRDGYSVSGIWNVYDTGLRLGLGYASQDVDLDNGGDDDQNEFMATASYEYNNFYTAVNYVTGEAASYSTLMSEGEDGTNIVFGDNLDVDGYEWAGAYTWGKTVFTTTYNYQEVEDETFVNNYAIDASYYFKPNFRTYISYNFNLLDNGDVKDFNKKVEGASLSKTDTEDELAIGIRYDF